MFRIILDRKQIEFVNGGFVQHDDANPTYSAMIDQTTLGHVYIANTFGDLVKPRVGWSLDMFGTR
jgi:hypothetical protein